MAFGNLMQLSPFDVLATFQPDYSSSNGVNPETLPTGNTGLGGIAYTTDGRKFRLCVLPTTGTTLAACKLIQSNAQTAAYHLGTVSAQVAGDTSITYTFAGGAATTTANQFAGGTISIVTGTGAVQQLQISSSPLVTASTTITLGLADPIVKATAASDTAELYANTCSAPVVTPGSSLTGTVIGVPMVGVTVSTTIPTYFWAQTQGVSTVLGQGTTAIGLGGAQGSVAGSMAVVAATTIELAQALEAGADGLYTVWDLQIS